MSQPNRVPRWGGALAEPASPLGGTTLVRVLELDPSLGRRLDGARLNQATEQLTGRLVALGPGPWDVSGLHGQADLSPGLLITHGFIARALHLDARASVELLGPGDLLRPWDEAESLLPIDTTWHVLSAVRAIALGPAFALQVRDFPEVTNALLSRVHGRAQRLAESQAIAHTTTVRERLHAMLWHLADRWGRVTTSGVVVPLTLSHRMLAELVGARRPTVSAALAELAQADVLVRRGDGTWLLVHNAPPERKEPPGRRIPLRRRFIQEPEPVVTQFQGRG